MEEETRREGAGIKCQGERKGTHAFETMMKTMTTRGRRIRGFIPKNTARIPNAAARLIGFLGFHDALYTQSAHRLVDR